MYLQNTIPQTIHRGDIYYADLGDCSANIGSEQAGHRPVIIIQNDVGNHYSTTVIVAIITSKHKKKMPTHVDIGAPLYRPSTICTEQLRTIDKSRLDKYIGTADRSTLAEVDAALIRSVVPAYATPYGSATA